MRKFKLGIALGGGGARGLAHIGVFRVLEKAGVMPDIITGTSMGALLGAMFALGMSSKEVEKKAWEFIGSDLYKELKFETMPEENSKNFFERMLGKVKLKVMYYLADIKIAFMSRESVDSIISFFLPDIEFKDLKLPFACVAVDILHGREVVMHEGPLRPALASSMAIPGIMPPMKLRDTMLVDGGVLQMVPVKAAKDLGCDFAVAVDVGSSLSVQAEDQLNSSFNIVQRSNEIAFTYLNKMQVKQADFLILPSVGHLKWFEIRRLAECIDAGETETLAKSDELKKSVNSRQWKTAFRRFFTWRA